MMIVPVNTSATTKGCDKTRSIFRALTMVKYALIYSLEADRQINFQNLAVNRINYKTSFLDF